jgi:hypothetical protein
MTEPDEKEKRNDSFVRWQQRSIDERGKTINLFLGMSLATIGFVITQLTKTEFKFVNCKSKTSIIVGTLLLLLSVLFLIWLTLNRLNDFRESARIADMREDDLSPELNALRKQNRKRGSFPQVKSLLLLGLLPRYGRNYKEWAW